MGAVHRLQAAPDLVGAKVLSRDTVRSRRHLAQSEETARLLCFRRLLATTTMADVARAWGVTAPIVSRVRKGELPLTDKRVDLLPEPMRSAFVARFGEPAQLRLPFEVL